MEQKSELKEAAAAAADPPAAPAQPAPDATGGQPTATAATMTSPAASAQATPAKAATDPGEDHLSLEGTQLAPLDRFFPTQPKPFLLLVAGVSLGAWTLGLLLAPDKAKFLAAAEWRFMPFYLAAHLIAVRLFVTAFTRNFRAGVLHLAVGTAQAIRGVRVILGLPGVLAALAVAAPFAALDFNYLTGADSRYERLGGSVVLPVDYLMWVTWSVEWFLNALIWVMLLGFLVKNCETITAHAFRSPIEIVVHERHYKPFLQMSAEGASVVLVFGAVTILYLWSTGGELTDYAGLTITATLLIVGFVPPWLLLRRKVRRTVQAETLELRHALAGAIWREAESRRTGSAAKIPLEQRLDEALSLFRVSYLEQLQLNLGRGEARAILLRLMAPALGVGWQLSQNLQAFVGKAEAALKSAAALLARLAM